MSKILVIKNADYSANKLDKVSIITEKIPCTRISLNATSHTFFSEDSITVITTVEPSNTTDRITWISNDESIVKVNNGVITPVGNGSTSVIVRCGSQSATINIDVSIEYSLDIGGWIYSCLSENKSCPKTRFISNVAMGRLFGFGSAMENADVPVMYSSSYYDGIDKFSPIILPKDSSKIKITSIGNGFINGDCNITWVKNVGVNDYADAGFLNAVEFVSKQTFTGNSAEQYVSIPEGADAFYIEYRLATNSDGTLTAKQYAENICNIKVYAE